MTYLCHLVAIICIYAVLALSLDLLVTVTGMVSLAHAAFFGIGAYVAALLATHASASWFTCLLASALVPALCSVFISVLSLHCRGEFLVLGTYAFQVAVASILDNWISLTNGPFGIGNIPHPVLLGRRVSTDTELTGLLVTVALLVIGTIWRLRGSPLGLALIAIRDDEVVAASFGKHVRRVKLTVFAVSASLAGMAGCMYALYISYIDPSSFGLSESILILSMVMIAGGRGIGAVVLSACGVVVLPELFRFLGLPALMGAKLRLICFGAALVTAAVFVPRRVSGWLK